MLADHIANGLQPLLSTVFILLLRTRSIFGLGDGLCVSEKKRFQYEYFWLKNRLFHCFREKFLPTVLCQKNPVQSSRKVYAWALGLYEIAGNFPNAKLIFCKPSLKSFPSDCISFLVESLRQVEVSSWWIYVGKCFARRIQRCFFEMSQLLSGLGIFPFTRKVNSFDKFFFCFIWQLCMQTWLPRTM